MSNQSYWKERYILPFCSL